MFDCFSFFNHTAIKTRNLYESESISRIGIEIGIDQIQMIPKLTAKLLPLTKINLNGILNFKLT